MEIKRTEQRINTEGGQILIEKVTDVPLLNKKQVIEHNMITLPLHSYEKLVLERNDRGTYTLTVNLKGNEGLGFNNKASVPIELIAQNVMPPYSIEALLLTERPGSSLYTITIPEEVKTEESNSREKFEEMLLDSEG